MMPTMIKAYVDENMGMASLALITAFSLCEETRFHIVSLFYVGV